MLSSNLQISSRPIEVTEDGRPVYAFLAPKCQVTEIVFADIVLRAVDTKEQLKTTGR